MLHVASFSRARGACHFQRFNVSRSPGALLELLRATITSWPAILIFHAAARSDFEFFVRNKRNDQDDNTLVAASAKVLTPSIAD